MRETFLWFGIYCAWALVFFLVVLPWMMGRIPTDERPEHRASPEWQALGAKVTARRGYRCAACGATEGLHLHHWTSISYGYERPWMVLWLCERQHLSKYRWSVHWWSSWLFSHYARGVWLSTALVVGAGKARRVGRRRERELISH